MNWAISTLFPPAAQARSIPSNSELRSSTSFHSFTST
nr:MAG TPA_asm: hypothetical protein [Caudoviricetes sp.]